MGFHIEPIVYSVRGGKEFEVYGDKYDFVLTMQGFSDIAMISLARGDMPTEDKDKFRLKLLEMGFKKVLWKRGMGRKVLLWDLEQDKMNIL